MTNYFIDLSKAFDGADYWPVRENLTRFVSVVSQLAARPVTEAEIQQLNRKLGAVYREVKPALIAQGSVSFLVPTVWHELSSGTPICVRVQIERLGSLRVPSASSKVVRFDFCDTTGQKTLGTVRSLPFRIDNLATIGYQLREIVGCRYSPETFGIRLYNSYLEAGAPDALPLRLPLCDTADGRCVELLFSPGDDLRSAHASFIIDNEILDADHALPEIMKVISTCALGIDTFADLADRLGVPDSAANDLRFRVFQRFAYAARRQSDRIVNREHQREKMLIFPSGEKDTDGNSVFGLAQEIGADGLFGSITWVRACDMGYVGIPAESLPTDLNFTEDIASTLNGNIPLVTPDVMHILKRASRWVGDDLPDGKQLDLFDRWYQAGLNSVLEGRTPFAYGFYGAHDIGTRTAIIHPIQALAPLIDSEGTVRAAFVLRRVSRDGNETLETPTVLTLEQARRVASVVMGDDFPAWLGHAA